MKYFVRESLVFNKLNESLLNDIESLLLQDVTINRPNGFFRIFSYNGSKLLKGNEILEINIPKAFLRFIEIMELVKNNGFVLNGNLVYLPECFVSGTWDKKPPMELKPIYIINVVDNEVKFINSSLASNSIFDIFPELKQKCPDCAGKGKVPTGKTEKVTESFVLPEDHISLRDCPVWLTRQERTKVYDREKPITVDCAICDGKGFIK